MFVHVSVLVKCVLDAWFKLIYIQTMSPLTEAELSRAKLLNFHWCRLVRHNDLLPFSQIKCLWLYNYKSDTI